MKCYLHRRPFTLESGEVLPEVRIAYHTYGELSPQRDNVIWVCHALTANSDVADWWPGTVEPGRFLDPGRWFVVCANILGSHYGTTGPLSIDPATGEPWYGRFPQITVRDMVRCHRLLADHLGIRQAELLIGSSIGGFQCLEWAVMEPGFARRVALIATAVRSKPWAIAFNESQRKAIETEPPIGPPTTDPGARGMAVARSVALLSYRGQPAYDKTQDDPAAHDKREGYRATTYQRHQGEKLRRRFNAYSYYRLTQAIDSHDIARGRGGDEARVLAGIRARCLVVAITSDILFPPAEHDLMRRAIPRASYRLIDSDFGHDGFLIEHEQLDAIIREFMTQPLD